MKKIITLTFIFFIGVYFSWNRKSGHDLERVFEEIGEDIENERYEEGERDDEPAKFQEYMSGIKTRDGETQPGYAPSYQFLEHQKARLQSLRKRNAMGNDRTLSSDGVLEWKERGPGNVPGRTRGLLVDPDDASHKTWYAGSASGGIWKTTNGGNSWSWITPTLPNLGTTTLAMAASNHNVIYAGTGEGFGNVDGVNGHGVFKSINRGQDWSLLPATIDFGYINRLIIDPTTDQTVVVVSNSGIYRTIDGGANWVQTYTDNYSVQDIDATPGNFSILFAAEYHTGVLKSVDGGQTWQKSNAGMNPNGRVEIAVSPVKPDRIFASCQGTLSGKNSDLYMSDDAGVTWSLVGLVRAGVVVDFLSAVGGTISQGWYDNTIVCDPFNQSTVYVGGVGLFQVKLSSGSSTVDNWQLNDLAPSFILLQAFSNVPYSAGQLDVGPSLPKATVEIRFGPGKTQKAHRFTVPAGSTSGVPDASYSYQSYSDVNFEVWDVTANRQLMVSFRDQNGNGAFDLVHQNLDATAPASNSREYLYIQNVLYNPTTPNPSIATAGGHKFNMMYNVFPALSENVLLWDTNSIDTVRINYTGIAKLNSTTITAADPYSDYDGKNAASAIHPDHHNLVAIPIDNLAKTFQLLNANDGGIYISNISTAPGTIQGNWTPVGLGYNTGQFYGADKKAGADEYIGGLQDNGTQKSPPGASASATSQYTNELGGDGFEVAWNNNDPLKIIGGYYGDNFQRTTDGGATWVAATSGLPISDATEFPFISKIAYSKNNPDVLFTPGKSGVYKSTNFGGTWKLTPISSNFGLTSYLDADVSAANPNIVWAGSGMNAISNVFVSIDNGKTYNATNNYTGATLGVLTKLATHPLQPHTAFALFSFAHSPKILRTTDLGQSWQDISGFGSGSTSTNGFPDVAVYSLYVRPDDNNIIWAGTEIGIIESLDNGASWALLTDFPSVAVWDMKGQDDQVVIATHGRGIWTARIGAPQIEIQNPVVTAYGTSPESKFVAALHLPEAYDSTEVLISATVVGTFLSNTVGDYTIKINNVNPGPVALEIVGFKNGLQAHGSVTAKQLSLLNYQVKYYNPFAKDDDFASTGFALNSLSGATHKTLQSAHPYLNNTTINSVLLQPIVITNAHPFFYYSDVALVEHGPSSAVFGDPNFADYVVVEATKDGLTWMPIANGYNSLSDPGWLSASSGSATLEVAHSIDLTNALAVGDTVLFRFRLSADNDGTNGWGWSVDELSIQQVPTGLDPTTAALKVEVFPNPARGQFAVKFSLPTPLTVSINLIDITGRVISTYPVGKRNAGEYTQEINQDLSPGTYFVQLRAGESQLVRKVIIKN